MSCTVSMMFRLLAASLLYAASLLTLSDSAYSQAGYDSITYNRGTFFGNATNDSYLLHMAVDNQGNVYGTGLCSSIPTTPGAYRTTNQGGTYDIMVFKMDPTMKTLIWSTYIGGSNIEGGGGIAVNSAGEVFVSGYTLSANFPITDAGDASYLANNIVNYFALKLSADGSTLLYSRILGRGSPITQQTASASKGAHIAINPAGEAFVFSHTNATQYQITSNAYQTTNAGSSDFVLTKLSTTGSVLYSTYFGGSSAETSYDICYANGKVYCTGTTASAGIALRIGKVPDNLGDCCVFVADDGSTCPPRRCFVHGTLGVDNGNAVWYDTRAHRVLVTGTYGSTPSMPYTTLQSGQTTGGFLSAVDTSLSAQNFITMIGGGVTPTSIVTRTTNSVAYVAGYMTSGTVPVSPNGFQITPRGSLDGLMISVDSAGSVLKYGTYMGGSGQDYSAAKVLLVDRGCLLRVIFGITTHSTNFPSTTNTYQPLKLNGINDQPALAMFTTSPTASITSSGKPCSREYLLTFASSCPYASLRWSFGDNTFENTTNPVLHVYPGLGTYKVTATAITNEGDTITKVQNIAVGSSNPVDAGPDRTICKNQFTNLIGSGCTTCSWSPGATLSDSTAASPLARPTKTTMYYLRGKDAFGCESMDSVLVVVRELKATVSRDTTICEGSIAQLQATGGTFYSWMPTTGLNSPNTATVLARPQSTTTYTVVAFDGVCLDTQRVTVNVIPRPKLSFGPVPSICANTPVELLVNVKPGGATDSLVASYAWKPASAMSNPGIPNPVVTPSKETWYSVTVTMRNGCSVTDSIRVPIQAKLRLSVSKDTAFCSGASFRLRANGAVQYAWSPSAGLDDSSQSSPLCTPLRTTTYVVIGKAGACIDTQRVTVTVHQRPANLRAFGDTTVCTNDRVHVRATSTDSSGVSYSWYPRPDFENADLPSAYLKTATSRTYYVVATNTFGCSSIDSVRVKVDDALSVRVGLGVTACLGETVRLPVTSIHDSLSTFTWTPNDGSWDPVSRTFSTVASTSKTYMVTVNRGSCSGTATIAVNVKPQPEFLLSADTTVCTGNAVQLHASSSQTGIAYRWLTAGGVPDSLLDDALSSDPRCPSLNEARTWTVEANLDGCIVTKQVRANVYALPQVLPTLDTSICADEYATLVIPAQGATTFAWTPADGLSATFGPRTTARPASTITYTITATTPDGCTRTGTATVAVRRRINSHFGFLPVNEGHVLLPGDTTSIVVVASADSSLSMPGRFDVVCSSGIFDVTSHPYTDKQGLRYIHVTIPSLAISSTEVPIAVIKGKILQTYPSYSDVTIENIVTDSSTCPVTSSDRIVISTTSCFNNGRNVELVSPLALRIAPNPADASTRLGVSTSETGAARIEIHNSLGRCVRSFTITLSGGSDVIDLCMDELPAGMYAVSVISQEQQARAHLLKR